MAGGGLFKRIDKVKSKMHKQVTNTATVSLLKHTYTFFCCFCSFFLAKSSTISAELINFDNIVIIINIVHEVHNNT